MRTSLTTQTLFAPGQEVGFENYVDLFRYSVFRRALRNNILFLLNVPLTVVGGLCVSAVLYRGLRGARFYQSALFVSFLPSVASVSVVFVYLLNASGPINGGLKAAGLSQLAYPWLTRPTTAIWAVLAVMVWHRYGLVTILFLTRLMGIDRTLLDAAAIDGATFWQAVRHVAIPQMRSIIAFVTVLGMIDAFTFSFGYIFVLTRGGPFRMTTDLGYLLYDTLFNQQLVGRASAIASLLLVIATVAAIMRARMARQEGLQ